MQDFEAFRIGHSRTILAGKGILIAVGLLFFLGGCEQFSVQKQLEKYVEQQKKESPLPRKMSDRQTLVDIRAGDMELIQVFTIRGPKKQIQDNADQIRQEALTQLKKMKAQISNLIKYRIVMTFKYLHEPTRDVVFEFKVKPWEEL